MFISPNIFLAILTVDSACVNVIFPFLIGMGFILFGLAVESNKKGAFGNSSFSLGKAHRLSQANYGPRILGFAGSFLLISQNID